MSGSNCCFLTCIQVSQEAGKMLLHSQIFKKFPQFVVILTVQDFLLISEAAIFLELPCFLYDPTNVDNLISGFSAFSKPSLYIQKFSVHVLLKHSLNNFEHYLASMWTEHSCIVVWTFFGIALLWDWNDRWAFLKVLIAMCNTDSVQGRHLFFFFFWLEEAQGLNNFIKKKSCIMTGCLT